MTFILSQLALALFNVVNAYLDAYRILKHKEIAHAINFIAYTIFSIIIVYVVKYDIGDIILFCCCAFFNRQLSFDIPLNLRRKLPWYYQSTANPPKALWDRIEKKLFGMDYDGKKIALWYSLFFFSLMFIKTVSSL